MLSVFPLFAVKDFDSRLAREIKLMRFCVGVAYR